MSAREAALLTLVAMERQKAWSNGHLKKVIQEQRLDRRDAALATRLCFGVIQNRMLLDHYLQQYSAMKLSKMESKVRNNLRLGLYQMLFMTKIPVSAAVSERKIERCRKNNRIPIQMRWEISCREKRIYGDLEVKALVHVSVNEGFILSFLSMAK